MKKYWVRLAIFSSCIHLILCAAWNYEHGTLDWAMIDRDNYACAYGRQQSPINLPFSLLRRDQSHFRFEWYNLLSPLNSNGTIPMLYHYGQLIEIGRLASLSQNRTSDSSIVFRGDRYKLIHFHIHTPAEHRIESKLHEMEIHCVHQSLNGRVLVVGLLFELSLDETTPSIDDIAIDMTRLHDGRVLRIKHLKLKSLLNQVNWTLGHFEYQGSLTTPPCTEGVTWLLPNFALPLKVETYNAFKKVLQHSARPIQYRPDL